MPVWFLQAPNLISSADTLGQKPIPIPVAKEMHLWDIIISGGPIMIPLAVLFVLAIFFFFERYIAIKKAAKLEENFMGIIRDHILNGNVSAAKSQAKKYPKSNCKNDLQGHSENWKANRRN